MSNPNQQGIKMDNQLNIKENGKDKNKRIII